MKMTFQEIRIIAAGPCITNQLRDVNTICRRSWYIAAHIWKIYDFCAPLLADLFLYSYESEFLQKLVKDKNIYEARAFNFTYRYIDDVLSINNSRIIAAGPCITNQLRDVNTICRRSWYIAAHIWKIYDLF
jgi:hypothetical protein